MRGSLSSMAHCLEFLLHIFYRRVVKLETDNEWQPYNLHCIILNHYQIPHLQILYLWNNIAVTCWEIAVVV